MAYHTISAKGPRKELDRFIEHINTPPPIYKFLYDNPEMKEEICRWLNGEDEYSREIGFSFHSFITAPLTKENTSSIGIVRNIFYGNALWETDDCNNVDLSETNGIVTLSYNTDEIENTSIMKAIAQAYPLLTFNMIWEGNNWDGERLKGENGVVTVTDKWDEPANHTEFSERGLEESCACSWSSNRDDWHKDCPDKYDEDENIAIQVLVTHSYLLKSTRRAWADCDMTTQQIVDAYENSFDMPDEISMDKVERYAVVLNKEIEEVNNNE